MVDESFDRVELHDVAIVGGGCYGTFYAGQMLRARERGKVRYRRLLIVDRNPACRFAAEIGPSQDVELVVAEWGEFFDGWLGAERHAGDTIVPSPLMPHLMYQWLVRRAQARWPDRTVEQRPLTAPIGTPVRHGRAGRDAVCLLRRLALPHSLRRARHLPDHQGPADLGDERRHGAAHRPAGPGAPTAGPALFVCRHRVYGVGMFDVAAVLEGDRVVAEAGSRGGEVDVVVGTVSGCHGAVSLLHLGARGTPARSIFGQDIEPSPRRVAERRNDHGILGGAV